MSVLLHNIQQALTWVERNTDPKIKGFWFMGSLWPVTMVIVVYLYFVLKIGPEVMKYRNPMKIDRIVMVYNAVQIMFSLFVVEETFRLVWLRKDYRLFCIEVDKYDHDLANQQIFMLWLALMGKMLDLLDTIFMVLRKRQNQVTFLHVYHHTLVLFGAWLIVNFYLGRQSAFFGTINGMVHVVMYSYYLLTIINPEYKNAWWKKYLTIMQLVQFFITGLHAFITLFEPDCSFPKIIMLIGISQDIFMFILFWDFYKKTYIEPKKNKQS